jgi:DNA-binding CsgD family transcriptional regulator
MSDDAAEAERRRLARMLRAGALEPLGLLLSQAAVYEQSLAPHPPPRHALSVLSALIRQVIQQVRDLEATLSPSLLESLGLEPTLEALAAQMARAHGLPVRLGLDRLPERPPVAVELALFRAAQDALERAVTSAHARTVGLTLRRLDSQLALSITDDGDPAAGLDLLQAAQGRAVALGGSGSIEPAGGGTRLTLLIPLHLPQLTPREQQILGLLAAGHTNRQIGAAIGLSPRTVNFHLDNIYGKLGVASRTEAVVLALRRGLVQGG